LCLSGGEEMRTMVTFWRSWAERLTNEERTQIEEISHGWAYFNWNTVKRGWEGNFYYFPQNSGYKDSPPIPAGIAERHKTRFIGLETGWLDEKDRTFIELETVAGMFPEEMEKLYQRFKGETAGTTEHIT